MFRFVRKLTLLSAAAAAGAALAVAVPALAPGDGAPSTAHFTAVDFAWHVTGKSSSSATIAVGGTVTFGYPSGASRHNADFAGGLAPTSCTQTAGVQGDTPPPLPTVPTVAGWSGSCRFDVVGTYAFHCDLHPGLMHGTVVVVDPNAPSPTTTSRGTTTTPPRTGATTTTTGPTAPTPTPTPGGAKPPPTGTVPPAGGRSSPQSVLRGLSVRHAQRGVVLHGAVTVAAAGARIDITALVAGRALRGRHAKRVRVGSQRIRAAVAGSTPFRLALNAAARGALHRHQRLVVRLRIVVTPAAGARVTKTVSVLVRERRSASPARPAY